MDTDEEIDWTPDPADPDDDTTLVDGLFPRSALEAALATAGFADVRVKSAVADKSVQLKMRLGQHPPYASVRDMRVAVQRVVKSIGFTVRRDGYLLRLHTGRVTAKFRVNKR